MTIAALKAIEPLPKNLQAPNQKKHLLNFVTGCQDPIIGTNAKAVP